jgi:Protein of unknown function (DUF2934)
MPKNLKSNSSEPRQPGTGRCTEINLPDEIRKRTYELFEARGCHPGHEMDDWLEAEREIKGHFGV